MIWSGSMVSVFVMIAANSITAFNYLILPGKGYFLSFSCARREIFKLGILFRVVNSSTKYLARISTSLSRSRKGGNHIGNPRIR
jgi:hypothetical protein